jgi:RimJ/RimL family protein N-acetyltransferase
MSTPLTFLPLAAAGSTTGKPPRFETERFTVAPLSPAEAGKLLSVLFQDPALAAQLPWMQQAQPQGTGSDAALREAFGIQLACAAGQVAVWGIVDRERRMMIGSAVARMSLGGNDVEVYVASRFWNCGVADEAGRAVVEWLEDHPRLDPRLLP